MRRTRRILLAGLFAAGCAAGGMVGAAVGDYADVEVVLVGEQEVLRMLVPVAPAPAED